MSTTQLNETNSQEDYVNTRDEQRQHCPSTSSSTPNSSGGEKQFQFSNNNNATNVNSNDRFV